jgi:hypothetical protein
LRLTACRAALLINRNEVQVGGAESSEAKDPEANFNETLLKAWDRADREQAGGGSPPVSAPPRSPRETMPYGPSFVWILRLVDQVAVHVTSMAIDPRSV